MHTGLKMCKHLHALYMVVYLINIHAKEVLFCSSLSSSQWSHVCLLFSNEEQKKAGWWGNLHTCWFCSGCHRRTPPDTRWQCSQSHFCDFPAWVFIKLNHKFTHTIFSLIFVVVVSIFVYTLLPLTGPVIRHRLVSPLIQPAMLTWDY